MPNAPKAMEKAKEKLEAVLNAKSDHTVRTNRIGTTSHPSTGTEVVNSIEHTPRESTGGIKGMMKNVNSRPAY